MKKQEIEIITLHHLCCAGGTIISKCLAAMPNVVFLSEIHPLNYKSFAFDPIGQLLKYDFFSQQQALDFFSNQINDILQVCQQNSKKLIIRDHSYIDFISSQRKYSLLKRVLSKRFKIKTVATLRNPIDCWLGMTERDWHKPVGTFEEYCSRYISFVDEFSDSYIDKYENFVELPDTFIKNICAYCNLEYDPNYKNKIANITLTGDSGRKSNVIVARPRRVYDSQMNQEFCNSKNFKIIQEKVGYNNIDDTDIKSINLALDKPSQQISFSYGGSNLNQLINLLLQFERGLNAILMKINDDISYHPIDEVEVYGEPVATSENLLNSFVNQNQYLDDKIVFHLINLLLPFKRDLNTILMKFNDNISYHPNLALRKPTQQSSYSSHCNQLQSAVNGIKDGKFSFHTELEVNPWWQVDLEGIYLLTEVQVYNRIDACADRVRTLRILLSSDGENWNLVYTNDENNIFGGVDGKPLVVAIASKLARYVRLQLNGENCLHLDEVEVYGEPVATSENLLNSFVNQNRHLDQKIVFHASEAGLCNRLRALCSCFCMSKILEIPLEICWEPQAACDCNFDDLYERPTENNVKFISLAELNSIDNPSQVIYINKMKHKNYFYETYLKDKVEQKDFDQEYVRFMRQLKVKPHLVLKINEFTQNFMSHGDILGVHIRRTDHVNYIRNNYPESVFSSDAKFISAIGKEISKGYSKIFLATDNQLTKDMIFQNFPDLVISYCQDFNDNYQQKIDKNNQRHTTVEDALIDLYLLSKCKKIIGSSGSSFSEYAALLGKIPLIYP